MYKTILRLAWPYLLRYLARYSADYLAQRREGKRQQETAVVPEEEPAQDLPPAIVAPVENPAPQTKLVTVNAVWYILSGVVLGSAIGLILANVFQEEA
jgi:hypothetical protein